MVRRKQTVGPATAPKASYLSLAPLAVEIEPASAARLEQWTAAKSCTASRPAMRRLIDLERRARFPRFGFDA